MKLLHFIAGRHGKHPGIRYTDVSFDRSRLGGRVTCLGQGAAPAYVVIAYRAGRKRAGSNSLGIGVPPSRRNCRIKSLLTTFMAKIRLNSICLDKIYIKLLELKLLI
jgi:hypothetical protein